MAKFLLAFSFLFFGFNCFAADLSLFGNACETLRGSETRSAARMRATNNATFKSVENVNEIYKLKNSLSEHDFNVLIYDVVDNKVSELMIKTTKADDLEVCVEVSGYLNLADIDDIEIQTPEALFEVEAPAEKKPLLYVDATHYYNDTYSKKASEAVVENFENGKNFFITDKKDLADYIVYPKVLKAKVEPINFETKRLHMVVVLELEDQASKDVIKEHQNKFVIVNAGENEQQKAKDLMAKLYKTASVSMLTKLDDMAYKKSKNKPSELLQVN